MRTRRSSSVRNQECRRAGLEPVRRELAFVEEQQDVVRVVDLVGTEPTVAVVPLADPVAVEAGELRREHVVQIGVGVAADGGITGIQGDVLEVVEAGEQAHLRELADPCNKAEPDVGVRELDGRVQPPQEVTVAPGDLRNVQRIQDRLVVLVDEDGDGLARLPLQRPDQVTKADRGRRVGATGDPCLLLQGLQLRCQLQPQVVRPLVAAAAEVQTQHGMTNRPVPPVLDRQPLEQRFVALEQLLQRVQEQALAEASRTRQEIVLALVQQPADEVGLVHVVAVLFPYLAEGLQADGQSASRHGATTRRRPDSRRSGSRRRAPSAGAAGGPACPPCSAAGGR